MFKALERLLFNVPGTINPHSNELVLSTQSADVVGNAAKAFGGDLGRQQLTGVGDGWADGSVIDHWGEGASATGL
jgi:hypothetical protein